MRAPVKVDFFCVGIDFDGVLSINDPVPDNPLIRKCEHQSLPGLDTFYDLRTILAIKALSMMPVKIVPMSQRCAYAKGDPLRQAMYEQFDSWFSDVRDFLAEHDGNIIAQESDGANKAHYIDNAARVFTQGVHTRVILIDDSQKHIDEASAAGAHTCHPISSSPDAILKQFCLVLLYAGQFSDHGADSPKQYIVDCIRQSANGDHEVAHALILTLNRVIAESNTDASRLPVNFLRYQEPGRRSGLLNFFKNLFSHDPATNTAPTNGGVSSR